VTDKKSIFIIIGSASKNSSNEKLMAYFSALTKNEFDVTMFSGLKTLPHFDPEHSINNPPSIIVEFRKAIENADGVIICTPEYVFSVPSGLKNAIEWCVSTMVFSDKPIAIITASANGQKGHEELRLIMKTVMTRFTEETTLLISGIQGKINQPGEIIDEKLKITLQEFTMSFKKLVNSNPEVL
jgi:NAD(P)H-dependent FMN reductase